MKKTLLIFGILLITACTPSHYDITFDSEPSGAKVYVEGEYVGLTPITTKVSTERIRWGATQVIYKKDGYQVYEFGILGVYNDWKDRWEFSRWKYFKVLEKKEIDTIVKNKKD